MQDHENVPPGSLGGELLEAAEIFKQLENAFEKPQKLVAGLTHERKPTFGRLRAAMIEARTYLFPLADFIPPPVPPTVAEHLHDPSDPDSAAKPEGYSTEKTE